jgi:hypothetical protein
MWNGGAAGQEISCDISIRRNRLLAGQCRLARTEVAMIEVPPKCSQYDLALELIRVEISKDKIVTDVFGCPHPGCKTEYSSQQLRRTVESGK